MIEHTGAMPAGCANAMECATLIEHGAACMLDTTTGRTYCLKCGQRLRYHRRKAIARGEPLPDTIAAASLRLEQ